MDSYDLNCSFLTPSSWIEGHFRYLTMHLKWLAPRLIRKRLAASLHHSCHHLELPSIITNNTTKVSSLIDQVGCKSRIWDTYLEELVKFSGFSIFSNFTVASRRLLFLIAENLRWREVVLVIARVKVVRCLSHHDLWLLCADSTGGSLMCIFLSNHGWQLLLILV